MRIVILFLAMSSFIFAAQVEVIAKNAIMNEKELKGYLSGNVVITKDLDKLMGDKLTIEYSKKEEPFRYEMSGNIKADITMNNKRYRASGNNLVYDVKPNVYTLTGDAFLEESDTNRRVYGDMITVDQNNGTYAVNGSEQQPVRFIFQIDDTRTEIR
ncbi:MAG: lipopolysaccharide transport periplasmic protein LptA [Campylobacteraceae bacterium]|jgi:lipopolysaccharide export system protein LptA|nr:lipopolysaccharide transport periplasmic protein LptA [Campylobacteraceae bacterium]